MHWFFVLLVGLSVVASVNVGIYLCRRGSNLNGLRLWSHRLGVFLFILAFNNFMAFWIAAVNLGGTASSGKVAAGRYYVSNHGELTEVSRNAYIYSITHETTVWITHPLGLLGFILILGSEKRKPDTD